MGRLDVGPFREGCEGGEGPRRGAWTARARARAV